jgi:hypothetical protein
MPGTRIIHELHELIELDPIYYCYQSTQIAGMCVPLTSVSQEGY